MTTPNPPCYRCISLTPLVGGRTGLCAGCEAEVRAEAHRDSSQAICSCGWVFFNDWERVQHQLNRRHNYQAWGGMKR